MVEILRIISEQYGVNISKMIIETNAGIFTGLFDIFVHDKQEIENLCKNINKIPEVNSTQRVQNLN
jgi:GTP pyrophosphokinase